MHAREIVEFDSKPGTSGTDVVAFIVVALMILVAAFTVVMVTARAIES